MARSELNSLYSPFYSIKYRRTPPSCTQSRLGRHTSYIISKRLEVGSIEKLTVAGSIFGSTATDDNVLEAILTQF